MHRKKKHSRSKYTSDRKLLRILVFLNFICKPHDKPSFIHENLVKRYLREGEGGTELRGLQPVSLPAGQKVAERTPKEKGQGHTRRDTRPGIFLFFIILLPSSAHFQTAGVYLVLNTNT